MVYVIALDEPVQTKKRRGERPYFTKTIPLSNAITPITQVALVFTRRTETTRFTDINSYVLTNIGAVVRSPHSKVTTYDRLLKVEEIFRLPGGPLALTEILERLPEEHKSQVPELQGGVAYLLPDEVSSVFREIIHSMRPDALPVMTWLDAIDQPGQFRNDNADYLWQLERDAANVALHIADMSPTPLRAWQRPRDDNEPFLAGLVPLPPTVDPDAARTDGRDSRPSPLLDLVPDADEQSIIDHDARTFAGWVNATERHFHIQSFYDGDRRVDITNVNNRRVEARVGVDLIYYHVNTSSFVLVQYKRLIDKYVQVNDRLRGQLDRMRGITKFNSQPGKPDQWRIGPDFSFLKLARDQTPDKAAFGMIPGIYLPLSYVDILLTDDMTLGPQGGRRLGYDTVARYLSNKQFIELTAHGLVGTVGVSVTQVKNIVYDLLNDDDSLVIATDHSNESTAERQRRLRSRD